MGSACSAETSNGDTSTGSKTFKKAHSLKHGQSIRIADHERDEHEEENLCESLKNPEYTDWH